MDATIAALIGLAASLVAGLIYFVELRVTRRTSEMYYKLAERLNKLEAVDDAQEFKITTIWRWMMRGAEKEAIDQGLATKNSPLIVTEKARPYFAKFARDLRAYYQSLGYTMDDATLEMNIVARFGKQLYEDVCVPLGLEPRKT